MNRHQDAARAAIEQLRMAPVMFELGARPHPAQSVYRVYLAQSDVFVGIYWQRYEWVGPGMTISGLEDELRLAGDTPRLLYFKLPAPDMEAGLARMWEKVKAEGRSAYKTFTDAEELRAVVLTDLATMLAERFDGGGHDAVGRDEDIDEVAPASRAVCTPPRGPARMPAGGPGPPCRRQPHCAARTATCHRQCAVPPPQARSGR